MQTYTIQEIKGIILNNNLYGKSLSDIAREQGIETYEINFGQSENSSLNISGAIMYIRDENKFRILIQESDNDRRKRFTFAHELGHFFLHKAYLLDNGETNIIVDREGSILYRSSSDTNKDIMEREANAFAAELLMPEDLIRETWAKLEDIDTMIEVFEVSSIAMAYRLSNLNIIK